AGRWPKDLVCHRRRGACSGGGLPCPMCAPRHRRCCGFSEECARLAL
ncbi:MAG: hypothetical protein AVDCRST_MAG15-2917, partial [uncultured Rubellimicrobium sp.]